MFWNKKEIYKQIEEYGRNTDFLKKFAEFCGLDDIRQVSLEHLKDFYNAFIDPTSSMYFKIQYIKSINKFLKEYGVPFIMKLEKVYEMPINYGTIESMKVLSRNDPTPKTRRNMKIVKLKDSGWSYSEICSEFGLRSKATVHAIYHREKSRLKLSTGEELAYRS